jgi:hypothetical protein
MSDRLLALPNWQFAALPMAQLMACVIGVQILFGALLCIDSPYPALRMAGIFAWWLLAASLPIGFVAIGLRQLRLAYLVLLALIPVALVVQQLLLSRGALSCNWL